MAGMLSLQGRCKPFDKQADGYARGEESVSMVVRLAGKGTDHIMCGVAVRQDGRSSSLTVHAPCMGTPEAKGANHGTIPHGLQEE